MGEFIERDFHRSRSGEAVNFGNSDEAAKRRKESREWRPGLGVPPEQINEQQTDQQEGLSPNKFRPKRGTRGGGRKINYKHP